MAVLWFVVLAIVGWAALLLCSFARWKWWWGALVSMLTVAVVAWVFVPSLPSLGAARWFDRSPTREVILFVLMLLGMVARVVSLAIEHARARKQARPTMSRWDFVYPMLFAVPTYGALMAQVTTESLSLAQVVLAFETGFFWQTLLKSAEPGSRVPAEKRDSPDHTLRRKSRANREH